ncbi:MAG: LysM peptidoglycan-binding domain-containing protein [Betaproteobacteria bacterium]|nr:MAG: LysM peptidoglycan-binding domain-containing protein [Betaproteobacteria bacterium]
MRLNSTTARLLFSVGALSLLLALPIASAAEIQLQDNRPDRYTVQRGDTLWGISGKFLKEPWRWPEIWRMNRDQIKNPHRIYPGDVIALDRVDGQWRLSVDRERETVRLLPSVRIDRLEAEAIPSIPPGDIEPFLTQPVITGAEGLPGAAKIIAARDNRVVRGEGDFVYAINVDDKGGTQWYIYRPGKVLRSYDNNEALGYEMRYLGTARVERFGEVSRMQITSAREEVLINDLLIPAPREVLVNYVPHAPDYAADGHIIALYGDSAEAGRGFIVTLDRGTKDGMEIGHVLAIYHPTPVIADPRPYEGPDILARFAEQTRVVAPPTRYLNIPPERSGLLFVFRVFDRVAYAIVLNAAEPVVVGDLVRKP